VLFSPASYVSLTHLPYQGLCRVGYLHPSGFFSDIIEQTQEVAASELFFITCFVWNSLCHKQNKPPRKETPLKILSSPTCNFWKILSWFPFCGVWSSHRWKSPGKKHAWLPIVAIFKYVYMSLSVQCGCMIFVTLLLLFPTSWTIHVIFSCLLVQCEKLGILYYRV